MARLVVSDGVVRVELGRGEKVAGLLPDLSISATAVEDVLVLKDGFTGSPESPAYGRRAWHFPPRAHRHLARIPGEHLRRRPLGKAGRAADAEGPEVPPCRRRG